MKNIFQENKTIVSLVCVIIILTVLSIYLNIKILEKDRSINMLSESHTKIRQQIISEKNNQILKNYEIGYKDALIEINQLLFCSKRPLPPLEKCLDAYLKLSNLDINLNDFPYIYENLY
jgi:hypothetical protein